MQSCTLYCHRLLTPHKHTQLQPLRSGFILALLLLLQSSQRRKRHLHDTPQLSTKPSQLPPRLLHTAFRPRPHRFPGPLSAFHGGSAAALRPDLAASCSCHLEGCSNRLQQCCQLRQQDVALKSDSIANNKSCTCTGLAKHTDACSDSGAIFRLRAITKPPALLAIILLYSKTHTMAQLLTSGLLFFSYGLPMQRGKDKLAHEPRQHTLD